MKIAIIYRYTARQMSARITYPSGSVSSYSIHSKTPAQVAAYIRLALGCHFDVDYLAYP